MACLDETAVLAYLGAGTDDDLVEGHLAECTACRMLVRLAAPAATVPREPNGGETANAPTLPDDEMLRGRALGAGTRLGRYRIISALGAGGMSVVYAAHDPQLDRKVAIKLLHGPASTRAGERLVREGRAVARLAHPNVVAVHDIGEDGGQWFVAMELVDTGTLADWLHARPRPARQILAMFVAAGRGLAAAHDAGLVHRDFKPTNVLVGADGRPRVSDFGIALLDREPTAAGTSAGTPAYMAPEQIDAGVVDARADQLLSFAVALFEALDGKRPFAGATTAALREAMRAGPPRVRALVPLRVQLALRRALSEAPADRFGSVAELLARIAPSRVRPVHVAGILVALGVGAGVMMLARGADPPAPCTGLDRGLAGVWDPRRADALSSAFAATHVPDAADTARTARRSLDAYAATWKAARVDACEAAQVRREQTPAQQELRMACLDERLAELRGVTDVLVAPDRDAITNAHGMLAALTSPDACADLTTLAERLPVASSPEQRAKVQMLRAQLAAVRAHVHAGQFPVAEAQLRPLRPMIDAAAYRPLQAEAELVAGQLADRQGQLAEAERALKASALAAEAGRANHTAAWAWIQLVHVRTRGRGDVVAGTDALEHAAASVERLGTDVDAEANLAYARGIVHRQTGAYADARTAFADALRLFARSRLDRTIIATRVQLDLAGVIASLGDLVRAQATADEALATLRRIVGDRHPDLGASLVVAAATALRQLDVARARTDLDEADRILRATVGEDHVRYAQLLFYRGTLLAAVGNGEEAMTALERSRDVFAKHYGPRHAQVATLHRTIASVALATGQLDIARRELAMAQELFDAYDGSSLESLQTRNVGSWIRFAAKDFTGAEAAARSVLDEARTHTGTANPFTAEAARTVGYILDANNKGAEAIAFYREAIAILQRGGGGRLRTAARLHTELGEVFVGQNRHGDAISELETAVAIDVAHHAEDSADARRAVELLAEAKAKAKAK